MNPNPIQWMGGLGRFGWNLVGLGVGLGEIMDFSVIFYRVGRSGWAIEWPDIRSECGRISRHTSVIHPKNERICSGSDRIGSGRSGWRMDRIFAQP